MNEVENEPVCLAVAGLFSMPHNALVEIHRIVDECFSGAGRSWLLEAIWGELNRRQQEFVEGGMLWLPAMPTESLCQLSFEVDCAVHFAGQEAVADFWDSLQQQLNSELRARLRAFKEYASENR